MHKLLQRQIRRLLEGDASSLPEEFLAAVNDAYRQSDEDRLLLERAMDLTSEELLERHDQLRAQAEERARSLSLLAATLESTADGILVVDAAGRISSYNRRFLELWRIPESVIESGSDKEALSWAVDQLADPDEFMSKVAELYEDPDAESFDTIEFKDGRVFERYSRPQRLGGASVGRVWSFRDVTQHRRLEERIRQSQKMEAIGRLAGGIAHDFNNLLTVITGYCDLSEVDLEAEHPLRRNLEEIAKAAQQAAEMTGQLLAFSRQQVLEPRPLDLNRVVRDHEALLGRLLGERIDVRFDLRAEPSTILADQSRIQQVLMNLAINARDAMPDGGTITIASETATWDLQLASLFPGEIEPGRYVLLRVRDTGLGIPPELGAQIFEPFFTTKQGGEGTGLGLATVYGIVKQSGGAIRYDSEPGAGTEFTLALRLEDGLREAEAVREIAGPPAEVAEPLGEGIAAQPPTGAPSILIVDDDSSVRQVLGLFLSQEGFQVHEAESPAIALERFLKPGARIDLLLTDVVLPEMDGYELAERLLRLHPELKVVYMSGYDPDARRQETGRQPDSVFLSKPFDGEALSRALARVQGTAVAGASE